VRLATFTAADVSPAMIEKARGRLGNTTNVSLAVEDGQALSFSDESFDAVARHVPSLMEASARVFSLGDETKLRSLFEAANFRDVEIMTQTHRFVLPSFDTYFEPFEQGAGSPGQAFVQLPDETRRSVREEVRRDLGDTGGPIEIEVEYRFGSGRR
jgi:methyltransferase family protein